MNRSFLKSTLNQEIFTWGIIVPAFLYFIYLFFPIARDNIVLFLSLVTLVTVSVLAVTISVRRRIARPLIRAERSDSSDLTQTEDVIRASRTLVFYDFWVIIIRWLLIGNGTLLLFDLFVPAPPQLYVLNVLLFANGFVSAPIFYLISEHGVDHVLNTFPEASDNGSRVKKLGIIRKIAIFVSFLVVHVLLTFLFILYLVLVNESGISAIIASLSVLAGMEVIFTSYLIYLLSRNLRTQLGNFLGMMQNVSGGDGDLRKRLVDVEDNELGNIALHFNRFIGFLQRMVRDLGGKMTEGATLTRELTDSNDRSLMEIGGINDNIATINETVSELNHEINGSRVLSEDVNRFIREVAEQISDQTDQITVSSESVQGMVLETVDSSKNLEAKLGTVNDLLMNATEGNAEMTNTLNVINKISDSASIIKNSLNVIDDIASQTNLLAMNAAIEAAHAGSSGSGFAVVAGEIRKLAENTASNSKEIGRSISTVLVNIAESKERAEKSDGYFKVIIDQVRSVSEGIREVNEALHSVRSNSASIVEVLGRLSESGKALGLSSGEMISNVESVTDSFAKIARLSDATGAQMNDITERIQSVNATIELVATTEKRNAENIGEIEAALRKFIV